MAEDEKKLQAYEQLLGDTSAKSVARKKEIMAWLKEHGTQETKDKAEALIMRNLKRIDKEVATIRQQLGGAYDVLPISYIAKHYFGKSVSWIHQRVNGYSVRGKVYTLNEEQKKIFNDACQDIARKIGSFRLT